MLTTLVILVSLAAGYAIHAHPVSARVETRHKWPTPAWWLRSSGWRCIFHAESSGQWHNRRNPVSRGGLQIIPSTWRSVGGHGDPADASPGEQLYRAYLVWRRDGGSWREWSTARGCGLR